MIVVTHAMGFTRRTASRVPVLESDTILEEGLVEEVLKHPVYERTKEFVLSREHSLKETGGRLIDVLRGGGDRALCNSH